MAETYKVETSGIEPSLNRSGALRVGWNSSSDGCLEHGGGTGLEMEAVRYDEFAIGTWKEFGDGVLLGL